jgi:hypothetical protein
MMIFLLVFMFTKVFDKIQKVENQNGHSKKKLKCRVSTFIAGIS